MTTQERNNAVLAAMHGDCQCAHCVERGEAIVDMELAQQAYRVARLDILAHAEFVIGDELRTTGEQHERGWWTVVGHDVTADGALVYHLERGPDADRKRRTCTADQIL